MSPRQRRRRFRSAALLLALFAASPAYAIDGNKLLQFCSGSASDQLTCQAYINGAADQLMVMADMGFAAKVCAPTNLVWKQTRDIAVKFISEHPEKRAAESTMLIGIALYTAFPCEVQKPVQPRM